ncbi:hypothetical protein DXA40_27650 [Blautia sp. OF01-4LB]|nr:hypothetical protein DXA40_27650 [Blautia sp. OF01-4LB]
MKVEVQSPYNRICISHNREGHRAFAPLVHLTTGAIYPSIASTMYFVIAIPKPVPCVLLTLTPSARL